MKPIYIILLLAVLVLTPFSANATPSENSDQTCIGYRYAASRAPKDKDYIFEYTKRDGIDVLCKEKIVNHKIILNMKRNEVESDILEKKQKSFSKRMCEEPHLSAMKSGWTIITSIYFSDGKTYRYKAECPE